MAFLIVTPLIIPNLKILEAHPFPIIHQENDKTCVYKYAGAKHLVFNTNSGCTWPLHISIPPESRPKSFRLMSSKGNCEKWQNNKENPTYSLDQCYSRSDLASYEMVWPHIEHDSDFVYVYCWNHTIRYNNISQPCENAVYRLPKYPPFYLNNVQSNKLSIIEIKNFTLPIINLIINKNLFSNYFKTIDNLSVIIVHTQKVNQNIKLTSYFENYSTKFFSVLINLLAIILSCFIIFFIFKYCFLKCLKCYTSNIIENIDNFNPYSL